MSSGVLRCISMLPENMGIIIKHCREWPASKTEPLEIKTLVQQNRRLQDLRETILKKKERNKKTCTGQNRTGLDHVLLQLVPFLRRGARAHMGYKAA